MSAEWKPRRVGYALGIWLSFFGPQMVEAGDIVGGVKLQGGLPPVEMIRPTTDHAVCGDASRPSGALTVSSSGGVRNAVISIPQERLEGWRSSTVFQLDQRGCVFVPRILIVPLGATVEVLNSDGILHNFHTLGRLNPSLNLAQPGWAKPLRIVFGHPETVEVRCDAHGTGFMRAWIVVASHPYFAVTDHEGRFRLPKVPPGPRALEVWHEMLGTRRVPVTVGASGEVTVTVTFTSPERR